MSDFTTRESEILTEFSHLKNWEDKYKKIIAWGKEIEKYPEDLYQEKFLVKGCQSQVWMNAKMENDKMIILADSDALIVKGLVSLLVKIYSGLTPHEILSHPPEFVNKLGFAQYLSPSRANGFSSMIKQIVLYATAFKALSKQ